MTHKHITLFLCLLLTMLLVTAGWAQNNARPVITPDQGVMQLDDIGLYQVGGRLRSGVALPLPVGWEGGLDAGPHGMACQSMGTQNGKTAWLLHCPWKDATGIAYQEFTVKLPRVSKITLSGATALRADAVGKSDGVTFRVYVDGQKQLEVNRTDAAWKSFTFDLTPEAGKTVTLRFETDPGPQDDSSFDFALWGDRRLTLAGFRPVKVSHPAPPALDLRRLSSVQSSSIAPRSG
nr:hypothetical protein [Armatimonadota bacterium]